MNINRISSCELPEAPKKINKKLEEKPTIKIQETRANLATSENYRALCINQIHSERIDASRLQAKSKPIQKNAAALYSKTGDIKANAQKAFDEVAFATKNSEENNFETVKDENGNKVREFEIRGYLNETAPHSMSEFDSEGNLTRKTYYNVIDFTPIKIQEFNNETNTSTIYEYGYNSDKLIGYYENVKGEDKDITYSTKYTFGIDNTATISVKGSQDKDKTYKCSERYIFEDGSLKFYEKGIDENPRYRIQRANEQFIFNCVELVEYKELIGNDKTKKDYHFNDGELI